MPVFAVRDFYSRTARCCDVLGTFSIFLARKRKKILLYGTWRGVNSNSSLFWKLPGSASFRSKEFLLLWYSTPLWLLRNFLYFPGTQKKKKSLSLWNTERREFESQLVFKLPQKLSIQAGFVGWVWARLQTRGMSTVSVKDNKSVTKYSRLPITWTLANSNHALTWTKNDFPWISFINFL